MFHPNTVIMFAESYGAPIPITWAQTGDVAVAMCLNMSGWIDGNYTLGKSFLATNFHTSLVDDPQDYSWDVIRQVESKVRPEFYTRLAPGSYESMNDLFFMEADEPARNEQTADQNAPGSKPPTPAQEEGSANAGAREQEAEAFVAQRPAMPTIAINRAQGRPRSVRLRRTRSTQSRL